MAAAKFKTTYTAAEVAALENKIQQQQDEIDALKKKLDHMNEILLNAQRARFGQSSEKKTYVLNEDQLSLFNETELVQNHKAEEPTEETFTVKAHARKKKRTIDPWDVLVLKIMVRLSFCLVLGAALAALAATIIHKTLKACQQFYPTVCGRKTDYTYYSSVEGVSKPKPSPGVLMPCSRSMRCITAA